jgi:aminoacylase
VFYGERTCWHVLFKVNGQPGHGSLLLKDTVAEKLRVLLDNIYDYRRTQELLLEKNPDMTLGDVTSINITKMKGGEQRNVLPPVVEVTVDIRMAVSVNIKEFDEMLHKWAKDSGANIEIEYLVKEPYCAPTAIDDSSVFWKGFREATEELKLKIKPQIFPAGTDAAYLRAEGIPAIGFSPMINTPVLLHDHDECLNAEVYLKGIAIYEKILSNVGNA